MTDIRARALAGETLLGAFLDLNSPLSAEICGRGGYDWLIIDLEHGAATEADLLPLLLAIGVTPAAALVRPQSGERLRIGRALDLGAAGVMVPRLDTAEQVREAVGYLRYPPAGTRGVALRTRGAGMGSRGHGQVGEVNELTLGIIQIESAKAVAEVDRHRGHRRRRRPLRRPDRPVALARRAGAVRRPDLSRGAGHRRWPRAPGTASHPASSSTTRP